MKKRLYFTILGLVINEFLTLKMKGSKYCFIVVIALLLAGAVVLKDHPRNPARMILAKKVSVAGKVVLVEIADTPAEREQGLSDRKSLCPDCGLLFLFDQPAVYPFWMRRMHFDIDILWIAGDKVVDITLGAKKPSKEDFESPKITYSSKSLVDKVLEVNAGWVKKNGIKIGGTIGADFRLR